VEQGLLHFPDAFDLILCQAVNHMNTRDYQGALELLLAHKKTRTARTYIARCYQELGDFQMAEQYRNSDGD